MARSQDGLHFTPDPEPAMVGATEGHYATYEEYGIEDPRITRIADTYYVTYTCYSRYAPCVGLARTRDFRTFERMGVISLPPNKDVVLFPEKVGGRYARLDRPTTLAGKCDVGGNMWISYSPDLLHWGDPRPVMQPRKGGRWEAKKIGAGPPPIKTDAGWLLIYHGVDLDRVYRAGAALLDLEQPWKVIARTPEPILEPEEEYERGGDVPNVVFPEGAVVIGENLFVFYGGADGVCCAASVRLDEFVDYLLGTV